MFSLKDCPFVVVWFFIASSINVLFFNRLSSVPLFYWDQDSWQRECLNQEKAVQQKVIQGVKRLQVESKIFRSWARGYHMEFFYPSQSMK